jgi:predicted phage terminase large subunit-like protein
MRSLSPQGYRAVLRSDFASFVMRCFSELYPHTELAMNGHILVMASRFAMVREGRTRRLITTVPPRHLKSLIGSVAFPAWYLGHNPAAPIICISYGQELSEKHARDCRRIMMSQWYRELFRNTRLSSQRPAVQELVTTAGGYRLASSIGGVLTGRGADLIIIDDSLKPADALSEVLRQEANDWYDHTLLSRQNDKRTCAIIIIQQRLHEDDLVGHVLGQEDWDVVRFPAIAEEDEEHQYSTAFGSGVFRRRKGEALHPEREPLETLEQLRRQMGGYAFAGQYQQAPAPLGGGLIKTEWFRRYEPHQKPDSFDRIVQSWDTASKVTELADYSVCTTWGIEDRKVYLLHVFREQLEYPDLKRAVRQQRQRFAAKVVLIEDKASGTQLIQELNREGLGAVTRYQPDGDKIMRMRAQTAIIEDGRVLLPAEAPWLADFLHELSVFPKGKYDDQVDSLAQFLDWFSTPMPHAGIFEYYRQRAEKLKHPERIRVRMRPPLGPRIGHLSTISGPIVRHPDRTVEVEYRHAQTLISLGWTRIGERYVGEEEG